MSEGEVRQRETWPPGQAVLSLRLQGLDCPSCASGLEQAAARLSGVRSVRVNFGAATLEAEYDPARVSAQRITNLVRQLGYAAPSPAPGPAAPEDAEMRNRVLVSVATGVLLAAGALLSIISPDRAVPLLAVALAVGAGRTVQRALAALQRGIIDMNVLMTVGVTGAALLGEWAEGATVAFLYALSQALQSYATNRARRSIRGLMELAPAEAVVRRSGTETRVPVGDISPGEMVVVRPGERIPLDGVITDGYSGVNQAPITGEAIPVDKGPGDMVYAGTINGGGALEIRVTKPAPDSTLARIIHLVEQAQSRRVPAQAFVDRFAARYTPAVVGLAAVVALLPPLWGGEPFGPWVYRGLTLVVMACPCALVLSAPVSVVAAIGNAARRGVLVKGGTSLEDAGAVRAVALDKTGTVTMGRPAVVAVAGVSGYSRSEVLARAAALEARAGHALAEAVLRQAAVEGVRLPETADWQAVAGRGIRGRVGGGVHLLGNERFLAEEGIDPGPAAVISRQWQAQGWTTMILASLREPLGVIGVADQVRPEARAAVSALRDLGVRHTVLLSGDGEGATAAVARQARVDEHRSALLPADKVAAVEDLRRRFGKVAMVGDGVNDAPALAAASVGVAMGARGTDAALETADIVLMGDDLSLLPYTVRLGRAMQRVVAQNITLAVATKVAALMLAFPGWLTLWLAILADMGASLAVTLNSLRLLGMKSPFEPISHHHVPRQQQSRPDGGSNFMAF